MEFTQEEQRVEVIDIRETMQITRQIRLKFDNNCVVVRL